MQDVLQTPFPGYNNKTELVNNIKEFIKKYESEYLGLIYFEINMQNYLGYTITRKIIEKVRAKYPIIQNEDVWAKQRQNLDYNKLISEEEVNKLIDNTIRPITEDDHNIYLDNNNNDFPL